MRFLPPLMILAAAMIAVVVVVVIAYNMQETPSPQQAATRPTSTEIPSQRTVTPRPTRTPVPTPAEAPGAPPTLTLAPAATSTPTPVPTATSTPTPVPTATQLPTAIPTPEPTNTPTPTPTRVPPTPVPTFEEWRSMAQDSIPYDDLYRYVEEYLGDLVYYKASIVQVQPAESWEEWSERTQTYVTRTPEYDYLLTVSITLPEHGYYWEDQVFVQYSGPRLLNGDIIEFVGQVEGLFDYYGSQGPPELSAKVVRLITKSGDR